MEVSSIAEQLLFTTVRIDAKDFDGRSITGTGFIFSFRVEDKEYLFLVTCKHIIKNTEKGWLTFIISDRQKPLLGKGYRLEMDDFEKWWFKHEKNTIDIAIMPFAPILEHIYKQGIQIFFRSIPDNLILNEEMLKELDAVEDVLFIGYPAGIWDERNLIPIVRKGITATPIYLDFNGEKQFLIDASVFPGSSGSPVFIYNKGSYSSKKGNLIVGNRLFFLGLLSAVYIIEDTREIVSPMTKPFVKTKQLIDLGKVFKAQAIIETIESFFKVVTPSA